MGTEKDIPFLREETKKRCHIFELDEKSEARFSLLNPEQFHFLYETKSIDFSIYFRIDQTMVEFIRKDEFRTEYLDQLWKAMQLGRRNMSISVLKNDKPKFERIVEDVRERKISKLINNNPALDRKTLTVFANLSGVSQMIVRGGITPTVVERVKASASHMVSNLMDSQTAIATLSRMISHDPTLYDHSASVAMLAGVIASQCLANPLSSKETEVVTRCALYHDVGKTCVPSAILNKPGKFTPDEFEVMKTHALKGKEELERVIKEGAPIDQLALVVAAEHHERFAGHGYPLGKKGRLEEDPVNGIHLYSRIVMVADVYSAMLMKRVYKDSYDASEAIRIMADLAAKDYDPKIFPEFMRTVVASLNEYETKKVQGKLILIGDDGKITIQEGDGPAY